MRLRRRGWADRRFLLAVLEACCCAGRNHSIDATLDATGAISHPRALGALMVTAVGAIDDVRGVRPIVKLSVEISAPRCRGIRRISNRYCRGLSHPGLLSVPLSALLVVATVNAVNLVDGLDGLAAGLCLMMSATLLALDVSHGRGRRCLAWWRRYAVRWLGSCRTTFIRREFFWAIQVRCCWDSWSPPATISTSQKMPGWAAPAFAPLLVLALPLRGADADHHAALPARGPGGRARRRTATLPLPLSGLRRLFRADRDHIHHRMLGRGLSHRGSVLLLYADGGVRCAPRWWLRRRQRSLGCAAAGCEWYRRDRRACDGSGYRELRPLRVGPAVAGAARSRSERKAVRIGPRR